MKNYTITVNGTVYDVTVEDKGGSGVSPVTPVAAGKVVKIAAAAGASVKKGDPVVVLEVMKMETPVVAPQDGTVASINCNEGQQVDAGALLATMN